MPRLLSIKVAVFLLFLLVLDISIFPSLFGSGARPVALYLFVIYVAFEWHWSKAFAAAFFVGLLRDSMTLQPFGVETVSLMCASFGLSLFVQKTSSASWIGKWIGTFFFVFSVFMLTGTLTHLAKNHLVFSWVQMQVSFWMSFWTACFMPLFFQAAHLCFKRKMSFIHSS